MFKKVSDLLGQNQYSKYSRSKHIQSDELFNFLDLISSWETIVGEKLAKVTVPLKNQNKVLTILTNHSAYSQQLSMLEETLKIKIFRSFPELKGKVKNLKFMVSTQHFDGQREDLLRRANVVNKKAAKQKKGIHPQSPKYKALRAEAVEHFKDMEGELLEQMISLYVQNKIQE